MLSSWAQWSLARDTCIRAAAETTLGRRLSQRAPLELAPWLRAALCSPSRAREHLVFWVGRCTIRAALAEGDKFSGGWGLARGR